MRVLAKPAAARANLHQKLLYDEVRLLDVAVEEYSLQSLVTRPPDIVHVHWPEALGRRKRSWARDVSSLAVTLAAVSFARRRGTKVVWTVHNVVAHDPTHPKLLAWFMQRFVRRVDGCIPLSDTGWTQAQAAFPILSRAVADVIPRGDYSGAYPDTTTRSEARSQLGIDDNAAVMTYFGKLRHYKGVEELIAAFGLLPGESRVLVVAGAPHTPSVAAEIERLAASDARVRVDVGLVSNDNVQVYLRASDLVVLPYREVLHSGAAVLAATYGVPALLPAIGALPEMRGRIGSDWIRLYDPPLTDETLTDALSWLEHRGSPPPPRFQTWGEIAARTVCLYERVLAGQPARCGPK